MKSRLDTLREIEEELKVRIGGHSPSPTGAARGWEFRGHASVGKLLRRLGRRGRSGRGPSRQSRQQRVVVKTSYTVHRAGKAGAALRAHARYLGRDAASLDGEAGRFYDTKDTGVDAHERVRGWEEDRHHFRFIVSPEYGHDLDGKPGGLTAYVREWVAQVERDLRLRPGSLEWVAVNHHNTDEPHAHVMVRGRRLDGSDLVIPRPYIKHGLRHAAQEIATRWLGERTDDQVREALQKEVRTERYTALDAIIERSLDGDRRLRLKALVTRGDAEERRRVAARLGLLERLGLATRDRHGRWTVDAELGRKLRDLSLRGDIIRNLYPKLGQRSGSVVAYRGEGELVGYVAGRGVHDELRDRRYLLVRDGREQMRYIRVANAEALGVLEEGGLVRVLPGDPHRARTDARIADVARAGDGVYTAEAHRQALPPGFASGDTEGFLRSHQRRLQTLARLGAAVRVPRVEGGWSVPDAEALARGDYARSPGGLGVIEIVAARSVESQTTAEAWTWLDRQMYLRGIGKLAAVPFDAALERAAEERRAWMVEHGHAEVREGRFIVRPSAAETLQRREWRDLQRMGPFVPLPPGAEVSGEYRGVVALHGGLHAIVAEGERRTLTLVQRVPPLEPGTPVTARANSRGRAVLSTAQERERERERDRAAGRG